MFLRVITCFPLIYFILIQSIVAQEGCQEYDEIVQNKLIWLGKNGKILNRDSQQFDNLSGLLIVHDNGLFIYAKIGSGSLLNYSSHNLFDVPDYHNNVKEFKYILSLDPMEFDSKENIYQGYTYYSSYYFAQVDGTKGFTGITWCPGLNRFLMSFVDNEFGFWRLLLEPEEVVDLDESISNRDLTSAFYELHKGHYSPKEMFELIKEDKYQFYKKAPIDTVKFVNSFWDTFINRKTEDLKKMFIKDDYQEIMVQNIIDNNSINNLNDVFNILPEEGKKYTSNLENLIEELYLLIDQAGNNQQLQAYKFIDFETISSMGNFIKINFNDQFGNPCSIMLDITIYERQIRVRDIANIILDAPMRKFANNVIDVLRENSFNSFFSKLCDQNLFEFSVKSFHDRRLFKYGEIISGDELLENNKIANDYRIELKKNGWYYFKEDNNARKLKFHNYSCDYYSFANRTVLKIDLLSDDSDYIEFIIGNINGGYKIIDFESSSFSHF